MEKTLIFENGGNGDSAVLNAIAPLLRQSGLDPNLLLAMNGGMGGFGNGGNFIWLIFLLALFNGNGFGGNRGGNCSDANLANLINNDNGRELLMSAIQGNGTAISQLASNLNCSVGQIQASINQIGSLIQGVGNQVGLGFQQTINAIQAGDCSLMSKIADCCCENRLAICQQTNTLTQAINSVAVGQERGFSSVAYETQRQTCDLQAAIKDSTDKILAGQREAEIRELNRDIQEKERRIAEQAVAINNAQQTSAFSQMLQGATAPIYQAIAKLQGDVNGVICKLPETVTLPYSQAKAVPNREAYCDPCAFGGYGFPYGFGNGFFG
jgi:hypothetical protein